MSDMVTIDIHTPSNEVLAGSEIPSEYSVQEVIDEVIDELQLPRFDGDGGSIEYALFSISSQSYLQPSASVAASLRSGDAVRLEAKSNGRVVEVPPGPEGMIPPTVGNNPGEIAVVLVVLDLNRHDEVTLSTTRPVGELIRQIASNYNLPPRDKFGQVIKYKLQSKALGSFLSETATLAQQEVPMMDRLTLHREEMAGAPTVGAVEVGAHSAAATGEISDARIVPGGAV